MTENNETPQEHHPKTNKELIKLLRTCGGPWPFTGGLHLDAAAALEEMERRLKTEAGKHTPTQSEVLCERHTRKDSDDGECPACKLFTAKKVINRMEKQIEYYKARMFERGIT